MQWKWNVEKLKLWEAQFSSGGWRLLPRKRNSLLWSLLESALGIEPRGMLPLTYTPNPFYFLFWNRVSLNCSGWPLICDPPVSDSRCAPPHLAPIYFIWYWELNPGACYLQATPPTLFIFYFETGSHYVAMGLAKLLRLSLNLQSSCVKLSSTGITSVYHRARLISIFWLLVAII